MKGISLSGINPLCNNRASMKKLAGAMLLSMAILLPSCKDDALYPEDREPAYAGQLKVVELPGILGVDINGTEGTRSTRADNSTSTSEGKNLYDGEADEYDFATPDADNREYYHYLLLFKTNDNNSTPLIFPIDYTWTSEWDKTSPYNNLTWTISKVFQNGLTGEVNGKDINDDFKDAAAFSSAINGMSAYVVLNFKLDDNNYKLGDGGAGLSGRNTVEKLSGITKAQFESLRMTDYKIHASKTTYSQGSEIVTEKDFFIMSNSVYSDNTKKVIDGASIKTANVFPTAAEAKIKPAIDVHVERLASRVTVSFDRAKMRTAVYDPYGSDYIQDVTEDPETNLPVLTLKVKQVNMIDYPDGIEFNGQDGYRIDTKEVDAYLRIVGYGLSNLEQEENLFKDINPLLSISGWSWNDQNNNRSYWARDPHYVVEETDNSTLFTKAKGYPHQFRKALDTDSVTSYHQGLPDGYKEYEKHDEEYTIGTGADAQTYTAYTKLGKIDVDKTISGVYLKYKSFNDLMSEFKALGKTASVSGGVTTYSYQPLYSLENTYYDPGQLNSANWVWKWQREPYATATNLIVLAEIEIAGNPGYDPDSEKNGANGAGEGDADGPNGTDSQVSTRSTNYISPRSVTQRTVYLGQNNIFYLRKVNFLRSKLAIFNQVMLSGGNAGIQILHGLWDQHKRWEEGDKNQNDDTHLDKVAWNEGSVLWFAEIETEDGTATGNPKFTPEYGVDEKGNQTVSYKPELKEPIKIWIDNSIGKDDDDPQYLTLIPAEISGGDGQCLIAPHENWMGKLWKYYLAPEGADGKMDRSKAVEISYNHLVALFHKIIGPVDVYTNGLMYFSVPIPHRRTSIAPSYNNAWTTLGNFSLVRNNWYNISVNAITKMGTPVHITDQPIVPVMDVKRSYINLGVELLDWHTISEEDIPMM